MQKNSAFKRIMGSVLVGGMLLSLGGIAIAASDDTTPANPVKQFFAQKGKGMRCFMGVQDTAKLKENLQETLKSLVSKGTFTQAKADKVIDYFAKQAEVKQVEMEKIKAMTQEERQAYFEKNKPERIDPLSELVSNGIITQEEADTITKLMPQKRIHQGKMRNGGRHNFNQQTEAAQQTSPNTL